jgi:hypothetical protein
VSRIITSEANPPITSSGTQSGEWRRIHRAEHNPTQQSCSVIANQITRIGCRLGLSLSNVNVRLSTTKLKSRVAANACRARITR